MKLSGYEGRKPNDLFASLQRSGVDLLIDVRYVPISRKRGFSKNALADGLASAGIGYLHLKGLEETQSPGVSPLGKVATPTFKQSSTRIC